MLRQLPPTITADETPDWLPVGWVAHSTVLKRGRQTRTYTNLRTGKKLFTKEQVLEYIKMDKIREDRESTIQRKKASLKAFQDKEVARERPSWLPDDSKAEPWIGSYGGNPHTIYDNMASGFDTHSKQEVLQYQNTKESEAASSGKIDKTGSEYIKYDYNTDEEDRSENEYVEDKGSRENVENFSNITSASLRPQPERMQKLESRAITQCLLEDEDMSSDNEENILEVEKENDLEETRVVSQLVESFQEENLHGVVVDKAREIPGLTGSLSIEINLNCEPVSDNLIEKDLDRIGTVEIGTRNIEIRDQESDSPKVVQLTQEPGDKNGEPLKAQDTQEETANESRRSVFFPYREVPSHSLLVFDNSNARSSANDLVNTIELGLNPCADTSQEKNISGSKKRKKSVEPCSSKNNKKKDIEAQTVKLRKGKKTPRKPQGEKGSSSVTMEKKPVEWPEPCPNFPFEPLTTSVRTEDDDSVIRRYLEQHLTAAGSADSNLPLPDFGLPSFSNIKVSLNEEPESKKKKSPDHPCVDVASSSLPCCWSMVATMQHTVAGNFHKLF